MSFMKNRKNKKITDLFSWSLSKNSKIKNKILNWPISVTEVKIWDSLYRHNFSYQVSDVVPLNICNWDISKVSNNFYKELYTRSNKIYIYIYILSEYISIQYIYIFCQNMSLFYIEIHSLVNKCDLGVSLTKRVFPVDCIF